MGRTVLGVILGLPLAAVLCGLAAWAWPGGWRAVLVPAYIAVFPTWAALAVVAQYGVSWQRVLTGFLAVGLVGYGLLWILRFAAGDGL